MAEVGVAFVSIVPTAKGFGSQLTAQTSGAAGAAGTAGGKKYGGAFTGATKSAMSGFAAVFTVGALVKGVQSVVAAGREAQKVTAITENRIKTMGNAANISAKQVGALADSIAKKTGVDDEQIQSGANLLLTFKNIREEVGKGNQIFSRATQIITDMSREKGMGGLEASSIRLGKALNDPVKGITALSRVGVQFTADQKKQIKEMVKSGDILGAQKVILKELETQFGGTAAASATAGEKLSQSWGQLKEQLAKGLIPALDKIALALIPIVEFMTKHPATVYIMAGAMAALAVAMGIAAVAFTITTIAAAGFALVLGGIILALALLLIGVWIFRDQIKAALGKLWEEIGQEWATAWTTIKTMLATNNAAIEAETKAMWTRLRGWLSANNAALEAETNAAWAGIKGTIARNNAEIERETKAAWASISAGFSAWWTEMKQEANTGAKATADAAGRLKGYIKAKFSGANSWLEQAGKDIMQGLIDGIQWGIDKIEGMLSDLTAKLPSWKGPPATDRALLRDNGQLIIEGLIAGMQSREAGVKSTLRGLTSTIDARGPGIGSGFSPGNLAPAASAAPSDADAIGRSVAKHLIGGTFRMDSRGDLQLIAAGG